MSENRKPTLKWDDILPSRLRKLTKDKIAKGEAENQKDIAEAIGVSAAAMTRYLSGNTGLSTDTLSKFAHYFGVSADYLLGLDDVPKRTDTPIADMAAYLGLPEDLLEKVKYSDETKLYIWLMLDNAKLNAKESHTLEEILFAERKRFLDKGFSKNGRE